MINRNKPNPMAQRLQASCLVVALAILFCGCAPLKVNRQVESQPPAKFGRLSEQAKKLFGLSKAGANATNESGRETDSQNELNANVLTSEQAAQTKPRVHSIADAAQLELLRQASRQSGFDQNQPPANQSPNSFYQDPASVAHLLAVEKQTAYAQGQHDAMQAAYQQPADRIYSNPPPLQPGYSPQYMPRHMAHPQQVQPQQAYSQQDYSQQDYSRQTQSRQTQSLQPSPMLSEPDLNETRDLDSRNALELSGPSSSTQNQSLLRQPASPQPTMEQFSHQSSGHFSDGINLVGTELRAQVRTATEIALDLQDRNEELINEIRANKFKLQQMAEQAKAQAIELEITQELLTKSNRLAVLHREKLEKQTIAIEDLEKEKIAIEQNADRTLKDIEKTLDGVLMNALSKNLAK